MEKNRYNFLQYAENAISNKQNSTYETKVKEIKTVEIDSKSNQLFDIKNNQNSNPNQDLYGNILNELINSENGVRSTSRKLLYNSFVSKDNINHEELYIIKEIVISMETKLYELYSSSQDKNAKFLSRVKSIVFNLGVSFTFILTEKRRFEEEFNK